MIGLSPSTTTTLDAWMVLQKRLTGSWIWLKNTTLKFGLTFIGSKILSMDMLVKSGLMMITLGKQIMVTGGVHGTQTQKLMILSIGITTTEVSQ